MRGDAASSILTNTCQRRPVGSRCSLFFAADRAARRAVTPDRKAPMKTPPAPLTLCELADTGIPGLESYSPFCLKVHRALRAADLPYTRRHGAHPGVFKKLNPTEQVPVLLIGDEPVADSTAILHR